MKGIDTMRATQFKKLDVVLTKEDCQQAKILSDLQVLCFNFLNIHGGAYKNTTGFMPYEMATDYHIWCVATTALKKQLSTNKKVIVKTWTDGFDLLKVVNIIKNKSCKNEDINYIHNYFCSNYHIKIRNNAGEKTYDIRTAFTKLKPHASWHFLFPLKKTKVRKNDTMLLYCIGNKNCINDIIFSGIVLYNTIKSCPVLKKGQVTSFGTTCKIDNYVTTLCKHYIY